MMVPVSGHLA